MQKLLTIIILLMLPFSLMAQNNIRITGNVTDKNTGKPLGGVSVTQFGSTNSTLTDPNGNYDITAPDNAKLMFKLSQHTSVLIAIRGKQSISIKMRKGDPLDIIEYFELSGRTYDINTGEPVAGVTITQDDTENSTTTDADGHYSMLISDEDDPEMKFKHKRYYIKQADAQKNGTLDMPMCKYTKHEFALTGGVGSVAGPFWGKDHTNGLVIGAVNVSYLYSIVKCFSVGMIYSHGFTVANDDKENVDADYNSIMLGMRFNWRSGTHLKMYSKFAAGFTKYNWTYTPYYNYSYNYSQITSPRLTDKDTDFDFHATLFGVTAGGQHLKALVEFGFGSCGLIQAGVVYEF